MNVFGSREGDPLLQNDPFDSDEEDAPSESSPGDESAQGAERDEAEADSVFGTAPASSAPSQKAPSRVVVRSAEAAAQGRLTELNDAFDRGWRLTRVNLRSEEASDGVVLAFVMYDDSREE